MSENASNLLAADTSMGAVTLLVADLDAMTAYYRDAVTLSVIDEGPGRVTMGRGTTPLVILEFAPQLTQASPGQAGLFHTAILFDSEKALAAALYSVARHSPGTFTGSADHLVSKAFYFTDPEGNGIELYWDRDRSQWSWTHGVLEMATLYLDPNAFLQENLSDDVVENPVYGNAVVGHVHLSVGDTVTAREFYVDRLGFETTVEIPGQAVFVSAGKYHHHMAMNVWNSRGAGARQPTLGLSQVDIVVPSSDELGSVVDRMKHFGIPTRDDGQTVSIDDPWANLLRITASA